MRMTQNALVSIVSPVYNGHSYLHDFVDSVIAQDYDNWELICVDDGSTDDSVQILQAYAAGDSRISCIPAEHRSAGHARNVGMAKATGKYICFLDSDDWMKPDMLSVLVAQAEELDADIVACDTEQYSMTDGTVSPMSWSVRWQLIPEGPGCLLDKEAHRHDLFQLFIVSPWNKLFRRQMLVDHGIQAQDQPAANDVVLTQSAMAAAKRICAVKKTLYVQRRDNAGSITGNLMDPLKVNCGYTASLGLKEKLQQLGQYEALHVTYQRLALHNCMWYLLRVQDDRKLFRTQFDMLHETGLKALDLLELDPRGSFKQSPSEFDMYVKVRDGSFDDYYMGLLQAEISHREAVVRELLAVRASKTYKLARLIGYVPHQMKNIIKRILLGVDFARSLASFRMGGRRGGKTIAFYTYEHFHYNVTANMIRICNPKKNRIIVHTMLQDREPILRQLGDLSKLVTWDSVDIVRVQTAHDMKIDVNSWLTQRVKRFSTMEKADMVIIPSAEYHVDFYQPLLDRQAQGCQVYAGVHNMNTDLLAEYSKPDIKAFFRAASGYAVIDQTLADRIRENGIDKPVLVFPQMYEPSSAAAPAKKSDRLELVITGGVEAHRKDYQSIIDVLRNMTDVHDKLSITLLGRAKGPYAQQIVSALKEMTATGLKYRSFDAYVSNEDFAACMADADIMLAPIVTETMNLGIREVYGQTKISGVQGDMISFARPAVVIGKVSMPEDLRTSVISYDSPEACEAAIRSLLTGDRLAQLKKAALENSEKFLPEKLIWH